MPGYINIKDVIALTVGFVLFTIVGTLSHEFGHYSIARVLGYDATINYKSCHYDQKNQLFIDSLYYNYYSEINNGKNFPGKTRYYSIIEERSRKGFWIVLAGPVQTMLTGSVSFIILLLMRKKFRARERLVFGQWLLIFLSLFWLRQSFNFVSALTVRILQGEFPTRGDEFKLAAYLNAHPLALLMPAGFIGLGILGYIVLKIIPPKQRLSFLAAGLFGGVSGFVGWMYVWGPAVLP